MQGAQLFLTREISLLNVEKKKEINRKTTIWQTL